MTETTPKTCAAVKYGYCRGFLQQVNILYQCTKSSHKKVYEEDVELCQFHCERILAKQHGILPDISGETLETALTNLFNACCKFPDIYTFWYCNYHDDGFLIKDSSANTQKLPKWCEREQLCTKRNSTSKNCEDVDWSQKGVIHYDGHNVVEIEQVHTNYQRYEGGFGFTLEGYKVVYPPQDKNHINETYLVNLAHWLRTNK
jgi:hypothetical protein